MAMLYAPATPTGGAPRDRGKRAAIDSAALQAFHRARFQPGAVTLAVVGDVETRRAVAAAARVFGDWAGRSAPPADLPPRQGVLRPGGPRCCR